MQARLADQALARTLVLICLLLVQLLGGVELCQVRLLQNDKVVEKLVLHAFDPAIVSVTILISLHDEGLAPGQQVILCWHACHPIGQVTLRCQIVFEAGGAEPENLKWTIFDGLVLRCQYANNFITVLAVPFFVGPLPKVHDEVCSAKSQ